MISNESFVHQRVAAKCKLPQKESYKCIFAFRYILPESFGVTYALTRKRCVFFLYKTYVCFSLNQTAERQGRRKREREAASGHFTSGCCPPKLALI